MPVDSDFGKIILDEFESRFGPTQIRGALDAGLAEGFAVMQDATPVDTGELLLSEDYSVTGDYTGEMFANAPYASAVNDGSSRQSPQPFADRGAEAAKKAIIDNCKAL